MVRHVTAQIISTVILFEHGTCIIKHAMLTEHTEGSETSSEAGSRSRFTIINGEFGSLVVSRLSPVLDACFDV